MHYLLSQFARTSFDDTFTKLGVVLKKEGFGLLTELNLSETIRKELNAEIDYHKILNIFNSAIANKGLIVDSDISLMFPFNMAVRELKSVMIRICVLNCSIAMRIFNQYDVNTAASIIANKLKRILSRI